MGLNRRAQRLAPDLHLLDYWDPTTGTWTTAHGEYTVTVGPSFDTTLRDTMRIHHAG